MLDKKVINTNVHNTICFGNVVNETEEYYKSSTECYARGDELRKDETLAYVFDAYNYGKGLYVVAYAYKA